MNKIARTTNEIAEAAKAAIFVEEAEATKADAAGHDVAYAIHRHAANVLREVVWPCGIKKNDTSEKVVRMARAIAALHGDPDEITEAKKKPLWKLYLDDAEQVLGYYQAGI